MPTLVLAALVFAALYAPTPQQAATNVMREAITPSPVAVRTNVAGRYAVVRINARDRGGRLVDIPILVQRFSFGWDAVDYATMTCAFSQRGIPKDTIAKLLAGMPKPRDDCSGMHGDSGPVSDVEAIRKMQPWGVVPDVTVIGNYAKVDWLAEGGGERVYIRTNGTWKIVLGGGGAHSAQDLRKYGIPPSVICKFHIYDAKGC